MNGESNRFRCRGFTLVEVMVALVVVAVALPALLAQVMSQVDGTAALREQTVAHWIAQNQWTRLQLQRRLSGQLLNGIDSGEAEMAGMPWHWQVASEPTVTEGLRRIVIRVGHNEQEPLVELVTFLDE